MVGDQGPGKQVEDMTPGELRAEVERLRGRVAELEKQVRDLWPFEASGRHQIEDVGVGGELLG